MKWRLPVSVCEKKRAYSVIRRLCITSVESCTQAYEEWPAPTIYVLLQLVLMLLAYRCNLLLRWEKRCHHNRDNPCFSITQVRQFVFLILNIAELLVTPAVPLSSGSSCGACRTIPWPHLSIGILVMNACGTSLSLRE